MLFHSTRGKDLDKTFEEVFQSAYEDEDCKILIPLENSLAGRVADIHYLLSKFKLQIHAEHFQIVEHNLLVKKEATIEDIKYVRSHAQAIGQCQNIINKYNSGIDPHISINLCKYRSTFPA